MKRIAMLLICAMLSASIVACSDASDTADDPANVTAADTKSVQETTTDDPYADDVPDGLDYGGYEFSFYSRQASTYFDSPQDVEGENGDIINDAVYQRNRNVEERLNVVITETTYTAVDGPRALLLSADDTYDMYMARVNSAFTYATEGLLRDITDLEYVDLTKPYWDYTLNEALSIGEKQYFVQGAYNLSTYEFTHALLFNKKLIDALSLDMPYAAVSDGSWTYDMFHEMAKKAVADLNGDGIMDDNDRYGLIAQPKQVLPSFWIAADTVSIGKDFGDHLEFTCISDKKFMEVWDRIFDITRTDNIWMPMQINFEDVVAIAAPFIADQGLFYNANCNRIADLRTMDTDFGIIPYPKYDDTQDEYFSRIENTEMPLVPLVNTEMERTGAVFELLCAEAIDTTISAYYDLTLSGKFARDEESVEMLDLVFDNRIFDYGDTLFMADMRDGPFEEKYAAGDREIVSTLASIESKLSAQIKTINGEK
nr:extracellular solute-binding protein [Clostridia bacterium]